MCFFASFAALWFGFLSPAHATCTLPDGDHGDMLYNLDHTVMQYCNGTKWISMDASKSGGSDNLGNHTATKDLDMTAHKIVNAAIPTASADLTNKAYVDAAVAAAAGSGDGKYRLNCSPSSAAGKGNPAFCIRMDIETGETSCAYNDGTAAVFTWKACAAPFNPEYCFLPSGETIANGVSKIFYSAQTHGNCAGISQSRTCTNGALNGNSMYLYESCTVEPCPSSAQSGAEGTSYSCYCSAAEYNTSGSVWGTTYYTGDSRLCYAARHAGKLSSSGGSITYVLSAGRSSYTASTANGVTSNSYGSYGRSYYFQ